MNCRSGSSRSYPKAVSSEPTIISRSLPENLTVAEIVAEELGTSSDGQFLGVVMRDVAEKEVKVAPCSRTASIGSRFRFGLFGAEFTRENSGWVGEIDGSTDAVI